MQEMYAEVRRRVHHAHVKTIQVRAPVTLDVHQAKLLHLLHHFSGNNILDSPAPYE